MPVSLLDAWSNARCGIMEGYGRGVGWARRGVASQAVKLAFAGVT
jgi:hypothetical protein